MEHIGNKIAVLLPIVSIASFLNPQGLGKTPDDRSRIETPKRVAVSYVMG